MAQNPTEMFSPKHPHRRLHVLVSILAFMAVIGSMALYQMSKINNEVIFVPSTQVTTNSQEDKNAQIIANLEEEASKSPPISESDRIKIIANLKKSANNK